MKITLVCHDIPYPPNHGARVDMWQRLKAFSHIGVELQLISWYSETPTDEEIAQMQKYVKDIHLIPFKHTISSTVRRTIDLWYYPLEVTSRIVRGKEFTQLLGEVRKFQPQVIFLDGIHGGEVAINLSKNLNVALVTRSHNIEHLYYRRLLASTTNLKDKFKRYLSVAHLEKYEKYLLKNSLVFYDISADDLKFWQNQGFHNGRYLPPLVEFNHNPNPVISTPETSANPAYDIVFLGNLYANNNVAGIVWFLTQVLPLVRTELPTVKVLIAGSNPVNKIQHLCEEQGIDISINPASAEAVYKSGRVLINPVLTGSGVSIKSIEMLLSGRQIVSTPQGIAGLPAPVREYFKIAVDAESFATEIIRCLSTLLAANVQPELLENLFGYKVIEEAVLEMKSLISCPL